MYLSVHCSNLSPCLSFSFTSLPVFNHPFSKLSHSYGNWKAFYEVSNEIPSPHTANEAPTAFSPLSSLVFTRKLYDDSMITEQQHHCLTLGMLLEVILDFVSLFLQFFFFKLN